MGTAFLYGNGGSGGGGLNFRVIGRTSSPPNPKENDIWINTEYKITSYMFSAIEPENPIEGMVWVRIGSSSNIEFNALKKNNIQVYPIFSRQYINGEWVDTTAKSYQNDSWVDWWNGELYELGNEFESFTGGWGIDGYSYSAGVKIGSKKEDYLQVNGASSQMNMFGTLKKIDTSKYNTLYADVQVVSSYNTVSGPITLLSSKTYSSANRLAEIALGNNTTRRIVSIPLTGIDSAYIVLRTEFAASCTINLYRMWME